MSPTRQTRSAWDTIMPGVLLAAALAWPASALSWSMGGHRVTGVFAARLLTEADPQAAAVVEKLMQAHPAAAALAARLDLAGEDRAARRERLFAEMAQWPDEVRGGPFKEYHRGNWHTVDIPYVAPGHRADPPPPAAENLIWALQENLRIAADASAHATDRAVALCWIFHLVGDLHQPLHAASLYNAHFPEGDRHGTRFWVRPLAGLEPVSLHYYWDSAVIRSQRMEDAEPVAARLAAAFPRGAFPEMRARPFRDAASTETWIRAESHALAIATAYRDGALPGATERRDAQHLDEEYVAAVRATANRRMALSAHRLAEILSRLFGASTH